MRSLTALGMALALASCLEPDPIREWTPPPYSPVNPVLLTMPPEDLTAFPDGVMAGDPQAESMLLWTRTTRTERVSLRVWIPDLNPEIPSQVDLIHDWPATISEGGYIHELVATVPGRRHGYAFTAVATADHPQATSRVGYFTAAPPPGALTRLTLAGTHGTNERFAPYPNLVKNAEFEPFSLYLHLGDQIYADRAYTLEEYREFWQANLQTEGFRAVLAEAVYLPVWDDHEVDNNYDPEKIDPVKFENAMQAFFEANPISRIPGAPGRSWRSWKWGNTVEFFVLDARSERRPSTRDDPFADPPEVAADPVFISAEQLDWFKQALLDSRAVFKLVLNSVPITAMPNPPWLNICDTWNLGRLDPPGGVGQNLWEFILGPGSQSNPLGDREAFLELTSGQYDPLPPDQFLWGYPTAVLSYVDLDPLADPPTLTLRYYEPDGELLFSLTFAGGTPLEPY
jgi:hypothetical protein